MRIAVVDLDDTLFHRTLLTKVCWKLSVFFRRLGIRAERCDAALLAELRTYSKVIIVTGRSSDDQTVTLSQLEKLALPFSFEPKPGDLVMNWKKQTVESVRKIYPKAKVDWFDDQV